MFAHANRISKEIEKMKNMTDGDHSGIINFVENFKLLFRQTEKAKAGHIVQSEHVFQLILTKFSDYQLKSFLNEHPMDPNESIAEKLSAIEAFLEKESTQAFQAKSLRSGLRQYQGGPKKIQTQLMLGQHRVAMTQNPEALGVPWSLKMAKQSGNQMGFVFCVKLLAILCS